MIISPSRLWNDFDPYGLSSEINILSEGGGDSGCKRFYFTALIAEDGRVRAYAELDVALAGAPVVLVIGGAAARPYAERLRAEGYSTMLVDLCGGRTLYPRSLADCARRGGLYTAANGERKSPWYVWAAVGMRAISALKYFKACAGARVAAAGIGVGAYAALMIAAFDGRICATIFAPGLGGDFNFTEPDMQAPGYDRYSVALAPAAYIRSVKSPVFFMQGTNDGFFETAAQIYGGINPFVYTWFSVSAGASGEVNYQNAKNDLAYLRFFLLSEGRLEGKPKVTVTQAEKEVKIAVRYESEPESATLYYSYTEQGKYAYWQRAESKDGGFTVPAYLHRSDFFITYNTGGVCYSTAVYNGEPRPKAKLISERLLYTHGETAQPFSASGAGLFHTAPEVETGQRGCAAPHGWLTTTITADPRYSGFDEDSLSVMVSAAPGTKVTVKAVVPGKNGALTEYFTESLAMRGAEALTLGAGDFRKSGGAPLGSFVDVASVALRGPSDGDISVVSMLWV
ncbi:MAG: hypothetical protein FWE62_03740 [Firmicutes bacterium]|nr:hypothetical protein [Bacillota bacterium]